MKITLSFIFICGIIKKIVNKGIYAAIGIGVLIVIAGIVYGMTSLESTPPEVPPTVAPPEEVQEVPPVGKSIEINLSDSVFGKAAP